MISRKFNNPRILYSYTGHFNYKGQKTIHFFFQYSDFSDPRYKYDFEYV